jgi:hypothetical protein
LAAQQLATHHRYVLAFSETRLAKRAFELHAIEARGRSLEARIVANFLGNDEIVDHEAQFARAFGEQGILDHRLQDRIVDAHGAGLFDIEALAEHLAHPADLILHLALELARRYGPASDLGYALVGASAPMADVVTHTPGDEAQQKEHK